VGRAHDRGGGGQEEILAKTTKPEKGWAIHVKVCPPGGEKRWKGRKGRKLGVRKKKKKTLRSIKTKGSALGGRPVLLACGPIRGGAPITLLRLAGWRKGNGGNPNERGGKGR